MCGEPVTANKQEAGTEKGFSEGSVLTRTDVHKLALVGWKWRVLFLNGLITLHCALSAALYPAL